MIVCFVDVCGIVDHTVDFFFITELKISNCMMYSSHEVDQNIRNI